MDFLTAGLIRTESRLESRSHRYLFVAILWERLSSRDLMDLDSNRVNSFDNYRWETLNWSLLDDR